MLALAMTLLLLASLGCPAASAAGTILPALGGGTSTTASAGTIAPADGETPAPPASQEAEPAQQEAAPAGGTISAPAAASTAAAEAAPVEARTEHVASVEDFRRLAANCALDTYSVGLTVILDADLDLSAAPGVSIPSFSGVFEGGGHSISGMYLSGGSNLGLFRYVQSTGVIRDLKLKGTVAPSNGSDKIGALAGSSGGSIENCSFEGTVSGRNYVGGLVGQSFGSILGCRADAEVNGKRFTGGIVGYSEGLIRNCENHGPVNTTVTEEMLSLDDLAAVTTNSLELLNAEDESVVSDSGGIAGYSSGALLDCVNRGDVGYQHFGYNLGGIAGRQAGFLSGCENFGTVLGRKDVAGIVGQMEPFLNLISEASLADEIVALNQYLNAASGDLAAMSAEMNSLREDAEADGGSLLEDANNGSISASESGGTISGVSGSSSGGSIAGEDGVSYNTGSNASENYHGISDRLGDAYGVMSDTSGMLSVDLGNANNQFSKVLLMMSDAIGGSANKQVLDDISEQLGQEDTEGRVSENRNHGRIEGDSNVGGVIGAMGIEYEFDMEEKLVETIGVNGIVNKTYETKCVSSDNINYGSVAGRKDRIGGVVGSSETGLVIKCEGYGSVDSSDGSYVGGVAGYSSTAIRESFAMCSLTGSKYVGGVAGFGNTITDCATLVELSSSNVCAGAIAGWADVNVEEAVERNVYVHDSLGAVDGISYAEKAAPVSYEELIARENVPEEFQYITVSFLADGELVKNVRLPYGGSLKASQIPAVPEKQGYAGSWKAFESENLRFNTTVEAEYVLHRGTIAVETTRDGSPMSILLVEGDFQEEIRIAMKPYEGALPEELLALEAWELSMDGYTNPDGEGYTVRFLMPQAEKGKTLDVYRLSGDEWVRQELGRSGSYVTFPAGEDSVIFAVAERDSLRWQVLPWVLAGAAALVVLISVPVAFAGAKKREAEKKASQE